MNLMIKIQKLLKKLFPFYQNKIKLEIHDIVNEYYLEFKEEYELKSKK